MSDYKKPNGFGGDRGAGGFKKKSFGGNPRFGGKPDFKGGPRRDFGPKEMFRATCSECRNACEVPFRPSNDKPVYCNDCFSSQREKQGGDYAKRDGRSDFAPRRDAPTHAHTSTSGAHDPHVAELKKELSSLHTKFDKLFALLADKAVATTTDIVKNVEKKVEQANTKLALATPKVKAAKPVAKKEVPKAVAKKAPAKVAAKPAITKKPVSKKKK